MALSLRIRGARCAPTFLVLVASVLSLLAAPAEAACAQPFSAWRVLEPRDPRLALPGAGEMASRAEPAFVTLLVHPLRDAAGSGPKDPDVASAVLIDHAGHLLTAAHVVEGPFERLEGFAKGGRVGEVAVLARDPGRDLALLGIGTSLGLEPARLRNAAALSMGEPVIALGATRDASGVVAVGRVVDPHAAAAIAYRGYAVQRPMILRASIAVGFSGGPVVDRDGRLVGMIASYLLDHYYGPFTTGTAYAVPQAELRGFLDDAFARLAAEGCVRPAQPGC